MVRMDDPLVMLCPEAAIPAAFHPGGDGIDGTGIYVS
jgi:hypothetical protein